MLTASYWAGVKPMFSCFLGIAVPPAHSEDRAKSGQFTQAHRGHGLDEWTDVFGSERLTGALLDRLTHQVHILEMNGDSYRLKGSRQNTGSPSPDQPAAA